MAEARGNLNPSATTSVMKNSGTWIGQERSELDALEIMGYQGLGWDGDNFTADELLEEAVRGWLSGKATTDLRRLAGGPGATSSPSASSACRTPRKST